MKLRRLFVWHDGEFHPIAKPQEMARLLKIEETQMSSVFGNFCMFGTSGKMFGMPAATADDLIISQKNLDNVRAENSKNKSSKKWLEAKIAEKRAKYGL